MPPRSAKPKAKAKKAKEPPVLTELEQEWQNIIGRQEQIIEDIRSYILQNHIELLRNKIDILVPSDTYIKLGDVNVYTERRLPSNVDTIIQIKGLEYCMYIGHNMNPYFVKEVKNLLYKRKFGYKNDDIYYVIINEYIKNASGHNDVIKNILELFIAIGYSISNLIVKIKVIDEYKYYDILLYNPTSPIATAKKTKPMTLAKARQLNNLEYAEYKKTNSTDCNFHTKSRYVYAEEFFPDTLGTSHMADPFVRLETSSST